MGTPCHKQSIRPPSNPRALLGRLLPWTIDRLINHWRCLCQSGSGFRWWLQLGDCRYANISQLYGRVQKCGYVGDICTFESTLSKRVLQKSTVVAELIKPLSPFLRERSIDYRFSDLSLFL